MVRLLSRPDRKMPTGLCGAVPGATATSRSCCRCSAATLLLATVSISAGSGACWLPRCPSVVSRNYRALICHCERKPTPRAQRGGKQSQPIASQEIASSLRSSQRHAYDGYFVYHSPPPRTGGDRIYRIGRDAPPTSSLGDADIPPDGCRERFAGRDVASPLLGRRGNGSAGGAGKAFREGVHPCISKGRVLYCKVLGDTQGNLREMR
jgi:hypothetical protein